MAKNVAEPILAPKKGLGASVGAIGMVFRDLSGRSRPDSKNPEKKLRFLSCLLIKGPPMANSYTPYKRLAPILSIFKRLPKLTFSIEKNTKVFLKSKSSS